MSRNIKRWIVCAVFTMVMMWGVLPLEGYASACYVEYLHDIDDVVEMVQDHWEDGEVDEDNSYYETRRIVIQSAQVSETFGAVEKYIYEDGEKTILCFDSEQSTKSAYQKICQIYGEDQCYVDQILSIDMEENARDSTSGTASIQSAESGTKSYSWGASVMGMDTLKTSEKVKASSSVVVAVLDSGINTGSDIFEGRAIDSRSQAFTGDGSLRDDNGHGTHVAGIIADLTPDNVSIMVLKIAGREGTTDSLTVNLAMDYAIANNADVINMSYGFLSQDASDYTFLDDAINNAYKRGIPVCVAAGNQVYSVSGRNINNCYPACNTQTISVGALDQTMQLASYSYYGSTLDFSAPGSNIISAGISRYSNYLKTDSGTSMASPHIAAACAYVKLMNKNLSVDGVYLELKKYCIDLGEEGKDNLYGYGCPSIAKLFDDTSNNTYTTSSNLTTPKITSCTNVTKGTKLSWNAVKNATGYYVYRRKNNGSLSKIASLSSKVKTYTNTGLSEADYCSYYIVAYRKSDGYISLSPHSNVVTNITLKNLKINSVKALGSRKIRIQRAGQIIWSGKKLQIQYSTAKTFKSSSTKSYDAQNATVTLKMPKKKTYYVRIRSYFKWNGKAYTSAWSTAKKIKVK